MGNPHVTNDEALAESYRLAGEGRVLTRLSDPDDPHIQRALGIQPPESTHEFESYVRVTSDAEESTHAR